MTSETAPSEGEPADCGSGARVWRFGRFEVDALRGTLMSGGEQIHLRRKTFSVLQHFVTHPGRIVSKDELLQSLWPGVVVTEDSLVQCVGELRAALDDHAQRLIKTVPRRGYMLDASVQALLATTPPAAATDTPPDPPPDPPPPPRRMSWRWKAGAGAALVAGAGAFLLWPGTSRPPQLDKALAAQRSIAILPFADLNEHPSAAFVESLMEDLAVDLAHLNDTLVFASSSTASFKGQDADVRKAGRALGATHVLTGSVERKKGTLLVRAQLLDASSGAVIWGDRMAYDESAAANVQQDVTQRIANALDTRLHDAHLPVVPSSTRADAVEATQQGMYLIRHTRARADLIQARALLETALAKDPDSVAALTFWGMSHIVEVMRRWSTDRDRQIALASGAFDRAIELGPEYAQAYFGRSLVFSARGRIDAAERACKEALLRWPNEPRCLQRLGMYELLQGRPSELAEPVLLSLRLNPLEKNQVAWGHFYLAMAQFHLHRDDEAYDELRQAGAADSSNAFVWQWMAAIDALHGRTTLARENLAAYEKILPASTISGLRATEVSQSPAFWAERDRFYVGLRLAGLRE